MSKVTNSYGLKIDFESAVNHMDDGIRERLHNQQEWQSEQEFFSAYASAHQKHYGEEFEPAKANPVW